MWWRGAAWLSGGGVPMLSHKPANPGSSADGVANTKLHMAWRDFARGGRQEPWVQGSE